MSSKSSSRSKYSHSFIGTSTLVLKDDFLLSFQTDENFNLKSWLPFKGKIKLPTELEVLKLVLFLRDDAGRTNNWVKVEDIYKSVASVVQKYWDRAGFITKTRIDREVEKIHKEYQKLKKDQNRQTPSCVKARENFLMVRNDKDERREKLFDIAHKDLEQKLQQDRIRGNLGVTDDDLNFLQDQRGERRSFMAEEDTEYQKKKEAQMKRRMGPAPATVTSSSSQSSEAASLSDDETSSPEVMFSLFSKKVSDDTKARMAARLLSFEKPEARLDLPEYPTVTESSELWDLVQPHSWDFFTILRVKADWLTWPLDNREESEDFRKARQFVTTVKVVNDAAERGIKLASDNVKSITKDSAVRGKIFQTVEFHRREKADKKKSTVNR